MTYYNINPGYYYSDTSTTTSSSYETRGSITIGYAHEPPEQKKEEYKEPEPVLFDINELEIPEDKNESS